MYIRESDSMLILFACFIFSCSNFLDHFKVVGCPIHISLDYMARNVLIFNLCFVFDAVVKTARYEVVLKKVANYLKALEVMVLVASLVGLILSVPVNICGSQLYHRLLMLLSIVQKQKDMKRQKEKWLWHIWISRPILGSKDYVMTNDQTQNLLHHCNKTTCTSE